MRHGEVSHDMYPNYPIHAITNGVHATTWTSPFLQELYDRHVPEWRRDNDYLRYAVGIPRAEIRQAHGLAKAALLREVQRRTGVALDPAVLTIGFARRAAAYKRADLLFSDLDRLRGIARNTGPLQVIYGGKAHPADAGGKDLIRRVFEDAAQLRDDVRVVYVENYDMELARFITSGVDLWLNTPQRPQEASGTSGMKAAMNGVPSLSILDGWWIEGCFEGSTGWAIGHYVAARKEEDAAVEIASLYEKLDLIIPLFYKDPDGYAQVMRSAIAVNASFFNTQRMLEQYEANAYFPEDLTKTSQV
jgi:starch phosphorylase